MKKIDCLNYLAVNSAKTSTWRELQLKRYGDPRNARAAQLLFDLAAQATEIADDQ
jgi:hypothetical protein